MPDSTEEEVYADAAAQLIEAKRELFKEELRRPEFRIAAIANLKEAGYGLTEAKEILATEPDYKAHKERISELELAVLRAEALVEVRKCQMYRTLTDERVPLEIVHDTR